MTEVHHDAAARPWMPGTPAGSHIVRLDEERRLRYLHRGARLTPERAATLPYVTEVATDFDGEHAEEYPAEAGARFGVPDSDLHWANPAWVLNEPGRHSTQPRNQLVLDFGRPDVSAWAHDWLDRLVRDHGVDQLRWIMNGAVYAVTHIAKEPDAGLWLPHGPCPQGLTGDRTSRSRRVDPRLGGGNRAFGVHRSDLTEHLAGHRITRVLARFGRAFDIRGPERSRSAVHTDDGAVLSFETDRERSAPSSSATRASAARTASRSPSTASSRWSTRTRLVR